MMSSCRLYKVFYSILKLQKYKTLKYFDIKYEAIFINPIKYKWQNPISYLKYIYHNLLPIPEYMHINISNTKINIQWTSKQMTTG